SHREPGPGHQRRYRCGPFERRAWQTDVAPQQVSERMAVGHRPSGERLVSLDEDFLPATGFGLAIGGWCRRRGTSPNGVEPGIASEMTAQAPTDDEPLNMQFGNLTLKQCKYGWMLFSGPYIGKCFELYGQYSESELSVMRAFLGEGSTVIDVGANIGDLTIPLAKMVGTSGRVYAI